MDKLAALKCFCISAETLQFRETALRLAVSPQVVSRQIAELEQTLGEPLFLRNTRSMELTDFGRTFLPQAQNLLLDSERLFQPSRAADEINGMVRITVPKLPENKAIVRQLAAKMADFPDLQIDWRVDEKKLNSVEHQIDIGIRISRALDPMVIAHPIIKSHDKLVAAPALLAKLGVPQSTQDLQQRFAFSSLVQQNNGKIWGLPINDEIHLMPKKPRFITNDIMSELAFALSGQTCALLPDYLCAPYLADGRLIELFPEWSRHEWLLYLYRPHRTPTSSRVLLVFDWLKTILADCYRPHSPSK